MLDADDRCLVDRDPDVPGLALVLDPEVVLGLVSGVVERDVVAVHPTYVRYKASTSCVVGYRVTTTTDDCRFVFAKAVRRHDTSKLAKSLEKANTGPDDAWPVAASVDEAVFVADAYHDRDLPALGALGDAARRTDLLRRLFSDDERTWSAPVRAIRHKPQRRWIGLVDVDGVPTYRIKTYRHSDVGRAHAGHAVVGAAHAEPIGWSRRRAAVGSTWIEGRAMAELLSCGEDIDAGGVGAALAELHGHPPSKRLHTVRSAELRRAFRTAAGAIGTLVPELADTAAKIARRAGRNLGTGVPTAFVHGDFSADQVVMADQGVHLIDFDESANGDPMLDLASFRADLICREIEGTLSSGSGAAVFDEIMDGYRSAGGRVDLSRDLHPHLAGALLRRAVLPFRERQPGWTTKCERIVDAASVALSERQVGDGR